MSVEPNYDDLLYSILCNEGNIFDFFDKIFDFLHRRTDYFKIKGGETEGLGLNPGEAEDILRNVFCKYMDLTISKETIHSNSDIDLVPPDYVAEETVITCEPDALITSESEKIVTSKPETVLIPEPDKVVTSKLESVLNMTELGSAITESKPEAETTKRKIEDQHKSQNSIRDEKQSDRKVPVMDPDCYNGACCDGYTWAQTLKDTDIRAEVPSDITSGKQVRVNIQQTHLKIELFRQNEWSILREGDLSRTINVEESTWTLVPQEHIHICLQKMKERWWDSFFVGDSKIDLKAIDPSIAYEELDRDSQVKIEELMYNEHLKRLGKPNIQQTELHNILKGAWDADGSPFKGQPFDPSLVNIQNSENFAS